MSENNHMLPLHSAKPVILRPYILEVTPALEKLKNTPGVEGIPSEWLKYVRETFLLVTGMKKGNASFVIQPVSQIHRKNNRMLVWKRGEYRFRDMLNPEFSKN